MPLASILLKFAFIIANQQRRVDAVYHPHLPPIACMNKPSADGMRPHLAQRDVGESDNYMAILVIRMQLIVWANRTDGNHNLMVSRKIANTAKRTMARAWQMETTIS